jgi:hypothetical protein
MSAREGDRPAKRTGRPRSGAPAELVAFRFPSDLLKRIDQYLEQLRREAPWSNATRAHAVRALLVLALDAVEGKGRPTVDRADGKDGAQERPRGTAWEPYTRRR